ncbi:hypothetical protein [Spongorhabdus nitratireducens]
MLKALSISLAIITLTACSHINTANSSSKQALPSGLSLVEQAQLLTTKAACEQHGGNWQKVGKLQRFTCILPASDAGKSCTDSSQCQVSCTVAGNVRPGDRVSGQCTATTHQFGCRTYVSNGQAEPTLCID